MLCKVIRFMVDLLFFDEGKALMSPAAIHRLFDPA